MRDYKLIIVCPTEEVRSKLHELGYCWHSGDDIRHKYTDRPLVLLLLDTNNRCLRYMGTTAEAVRYVRRNYPDLPRLTARQWLEQVTNMEEL